MFNFLHTIFIKITSVVASVIIAAGLVSVPAPQQKAPLPLATLVETKQDTQELEKIKLEAKLNQANAEVEKAQSKAKEAKRKIAEENLRKQEEEQTRQLEQQRIQQELAQQNLLSCNGKNWSPCPAGQRFYCPTTGDAQCIIENAQTSSTTSRLKYCLQLVAEPENYKDPCDDPTYDATQKAFCGLATGGLRTSQSTRFSDCLGTSHTPSYSPPAPSYLPLPPIDSGLDRIGQERRLEDLERNQRQIEQEQKRKDNEQFIDCVTSGRVGCGL